MQIKILGSGPSSGVPMALGHFGNKQTNKNSEIDTANPKNIRSRSCFVLQDTNKKLLVECGPELREQTLKHKITDSDFIRNVFISHHHFDHCAAVWELEHIARNFDKQCNIFCNQETADVLKERYYFVFNKKNSDAVYNEPIVKLNIVENYKEYNDLFILGCLHYNLNSIGFRYKDFVFTPDLHILPNESRKYMKNAKLWLLQCNFLYESDYARKIHTTLPRALEMIEELKPDRAILTHLSAEIDYEKISKILPKNVELAFDGMEIKI